MADAARKGDVKLKDWILTYTGQLSVSDPVRDNTGHRRFDEVRSMCQPATRMTAWVASVVRRPCCAVRCCCLPLQRVGDV